MRAVHSTLAELEELRFECLLSPTVSATWESADRWLTHSVSFFSLLSSRSFSGGGDLPSNTDEAGPQLVDRHSLSTGMTPPGGVYGHPATAYGGHHSSSHACPRVLPFAEIFRMFNPHIPQ